MFAMRKRGGERNPFARLDAVGNKLQQADHDVHRRLLLQEVKAS